MSKEKTIEEKYTKKTQYEHILTLPDTYIGSIEKNPTDCYVFKDGKIEKETIELIPGLYKIFDEILVNAIDQWTRLKMNGDKYQVENIRVSIDREKNSVTVYNDGRGIPIEFHKEHQVFIPELIFGELLSSENYDQDEKKITGGKNGLGAKLTNIYSTEFHLETVDVQQKKKYTQKFEQNMSVKHDAIIKSYSGKPYTQIIFHPDLEKFGIPDGIPDDIYNFMIKRVYDICACTDVNVYFNDEKIGMKGLLKYSELYFEDKTEKVYEYVNDRWEVVVVVGDYDQISFVNGINTISGGKHVENVCNTISRKIAKIVKEKGYKRKKFVINQKHIKENMIIFLRSVIENPKFKSQTKEYLDNKVDNFGSKFDISDKFIDKLLKTSLLDRTIALSNFKENILVDKKVNKKVNVLKGIDKLDDANLAGSSRSNECTLILTEGDSAKALAVAGVSTIGRDLFGIYPLRGKLRNTRDVNVKDIKTPEIINLMKILGLSFSTKKQNINEVFSKMRYGRIMIFTDQDVDGSHIKGLVMNFFHTFWPELLTKEGFIISLMTPIIKAINKSEKIDFYTMTEYEDWLSTKQGKYQIKYYKGLGTSTSQDAKEYFRDFEEKKVEYYAEPINDEFKDIDLNDKSFNLAFNKEYSDSRKDWLKAYDRNSIILQTQKKVSYFEFVNKDLIHFSNYDTERSIPNIMDGLKTSQRKILFSVIKKNQKSPIKVSQLAGYVSEHSAYHHGETSLTECIIGMAQNFVGSNNIELLCPDGSFGTRIQGGKDAASPRYIWTYLTSLAQSIFIQDDFDILDYRYDDGQKIEPYYYVPIIPMLLVNGCEGIGTGFSTKIPPFNPLDLVENIELKLNGQNPKQLIPWFRGFKGDVVDYDYDKFQNIGKYRKTSDSQIIIEELPIGKWTDDYKSYLEKLIYDKTADKFVKDQCIHSFKNLSTESIIKFEINLDFAVLYDMEINKKVFKTFKLIDQKQTSMSNMHLFNHECVIQKYEDPLEIFNEFYDIRYKFYTKRREFKLNKLKQQLIILSAKVRFIQDFIDKKIDIINQDDVVINEQLEKLEYPKIDDTYDYLLNMAIRTLTKKRIDELNNSLDNKQKEYDDLFKKNEKDLWMEDLEKFKVEYQKMMDEYEDLYMNAAVEPVETKSKSKPKAKKPKKK